MEKFFAMSLRGGLSFLLGLFLGLISLALFSSIIPPTFGERLTLTALFIGIGIGFAVFVSWFKPESTRKVMITSFVLALGLAILGSLAGYLYANIFDIQVRNNYLVASGSAEGSAMWTYSVGLSVMLATLVSGAYYAFRLFRYHEV